MLLSARNALAFCPHFQLGRTRRQTHQNLDSIMYPNTIKFAAILFAVFILATVISTYIDFHHDPDVMSRQILLIMMAIFLAPSCLIFLYIMLRRNWARMLWLLAFVVGTVLMLFNQHQVHYNHVSLRYFAMLQELLQVAITVLLFLPASNHWFKRSDKNE